MRYAIILTSGAILQTGSVATPEDLEKQGGDLLSVEAPEGVTDSTHWYRRDTGQFVAYPPRPGQWAEFDFQQTRWRDMRTAEQKARDMDRARNIATAMVNEWAGRQRKRFITDAPGQDLVYMAKEAEAARWIADSPDSSDLTGFPLIAAESGIVADSPHEVAQLWLNMAHVWRQEAARIEAARARAVRAIRDAETEDAALTIADALTDHHDQHPPSTPK